MKIQKISLSLLLTAVSLLSAEDAKKPPITLLARAGNFLAGTANLTGAAIQATALGAIAYGMKEVLLPAYRKDKDSMVVKIQGMMCFGAAAVFIPHLVKFAKSSLKFYKKAFGSSQLPSSTKQ